MMPCITDPLWTARPIVRLFLEECMGGSYMQQEYHALEQDKKIKNGYI
jgi:hypothetical protein